MFHQTISDPLFKNDDMKNILLMVSLLLSLTSFQTNTENNHYEKDNYQVDYPTDWELNTSGLMGSKFYLFSPLDEPGDDFRENIGLIIQDLQGQKISMEEYVELSLNQLPQMLSELVIEKDEAVSKDCHSLQYTFQQGNFHLRILQYVWLQEGSAYILTFTSEVDQFEKHLPTAQSILDSFEIVKE